jgi:hypothetical protein
MGRTIRVVTFVLIPLISSGCGGFELQSTWRQQDIIVDGEAGDWANALTYSDEANADIGIVNDENDLYICLIPRERSVQDQIMVRGLTLWFDPDGGKAERFGVRFPLGLLESGGMKSLMGSMRPGDTESRLQMLEDFERSLTHMEVLRQDTTRVCLDASQGIEVRASISGARSLIYEIRIPLQGQDQQLLAIGAAPGSTIGVGLETPEIDRNAMRRSGMGGGRASGMSEGGTPRGGQGRMGRGGGGRPDIPEPLQAWGTLRLASNAGQG